MKRAPPAGERFSAAMVPPWASTICLEMLRPKPEWVPHFSSTVFDLHFDFVGDHVQAVFGEVDLPFAG